MSVSCFIINFAHHLKLRFGAKDDRPKKGLAFPSEPRIKASQFYVRNGFSSTVAQEPASSCCMVSVKYSAVRMNKNDEGA